MKKKNKLLLDDGIKFEIIKLPNSKFGTEQLEKLKIEINKTYKGLKYANKIKILKEGHSPSV